jgi:hypothetical protein
MATVLTTLLATPAAMASPTSTPTGQAGQQVPTGQQRAVHPVRAVGVEVPSRTTVAYWQRLAQCETGSRWSGLGSTFQGGLGIWWGNWDRWTAILGLSGYQDAGDAPPLVQIRVADWAYRNDSPRPYWGCMSLVGRPQ